MIEMRSIYRALYFCYYISSSSDRQVLDPRGWRPLDETMPRVIKLGDHIFPSLRIRVRGWAEHTCILPFSHVQETFISNLLAMH